ncbi:MAG: hypothetical protein AAGI48_08835 [Verrucomicrobiota bacterium]
MKLPVALVHLALVLPIIGGEKARFETAKEPKIGESGAFELTTSNRAILKTETNGYILLDLLESSREDGGKTFTEACSISWTWITRDSVQADKTRGFIRYRSEKAEGNSITVTEIGGSDTIEVGALSIRWSYSSPERVFLYPSPGTEYTTIIVEKGNRGKRAARYESDSDGTGKSQPQSEGRSR